MVFSLGVNVWYVCHLSDWREPKNYFVFLLCISGWVFNNSKDLCIKEQTPNTHEIFRAIELKVVWALLKCSYTNIWAKRDVKLKWNSITFICYFFANHAKYCDPYWDREKHYHSKKPHHRQKHVIECKREKRDSTMSVAEGGQSEKDSSLFTEYWILDILIEMRLFSGFCFERKFNVIGLWERAPLVSFI